MSNVIVRKITRCKSIYSMISFLLISRTGKTDIWGYKSGSCYLLIVKIDISITSVLLRLWKYPIL